MLIVELFSNFIGSKKIGNLIPVDRPIFKNMRSIQPNNDNYCLQIGRY